MSKTSGSPNFVTWTALVFAMLLVACSGDAATELANDGEQTEPMTDEHSITDDPDSDPDNESVGDVLTVEIGEPPFAEPDLDQPSASEEISEDPAGEPSEVILDADPEDGDDIAQAGLAGAESALCGTIQIGVDAATDGAMDLVESQRAALLERADSLSDRQLVALVSELADEPLTEVAVLADALDRCVTLGFER